MFGRGIFVRIWTFPTWQGPQWKFVNAGNFQGSAQEIRLASSLCALTISLFLMVHISRLSGRCWYLMWKPVLQLEEHLLQVITSMFKTKPYYHACGWLGSCLWFIIFAVSTVNIEKYLFCLWGCLLLSLNRNKSYAVGERMWFTCALKCSRYVIRHHSHKPSYAVIL